MRSLAKKSPKIARFGTRLGRAWGILPRLGTNHTHKPYIDELQILSSLCMPRYDFATAVKGATSEQLRDRVESAFPIYPVQGVRAVGLQLTPLSYTRMCNSGYLNEATFVEHTVSFVCVDVQLTTSGCVHWRKSTRKSPLSGPILEGHMASCPAQGQITHTNHTSMNYKYCLVCACQGMISPLQSKVPPQNNCVTELGVPFQYALFKVSAQLVCSWLP